MCHSLGTSKGKKDTHTVTTTLSINCEMPWVGRRILISDALRCPEVGCPSWWVSKERTRVLSIPFYSVQLSTNALSPCSSPAWQQEGRCIFIPHIPFAKGRKKHECIRQDSARETKPARREIGRRRLRERWRWGGYRYRTVCFSVQGIGLHNCGSGWPRRKPVG